MKRLSVHSQVKLDLELFIIIKMQMKKSIKILLCCVCALLVLSLALSICISVQIGKIIDSSVENRGENNPYGERISDADYSQLCCSDPRAEETLRAGGDETSQRSLVWPSCTFLSGQAKYRRSYQLCDHEGTLITCSQGEPVYIQFEIRARKVIITSVEVKQK